MEQTNPTATEALLDYAMTEEQVIQMIKSLTYIEEKCQLPNIYEYLFNTGICANLVSQLGCLDTDNFYYQNLDNILQDMFETWDNFSGQCMFPILMGEQSYYRYATEKKSTWFRWEGVQLEERLKLIAHLKKELNLLLKHILSNQICRQDN